MCKRSLEWHIYHLFTKKYKIKSELFSWFDPLYLLDKSKESWEFKQSKLILLQCTVPRGRDPYENVNYSNKIQFPS